MKKFEKKTHAHNHPLLGTASVISAECLQPSVYSLKLELALPAGSNSVPVSGQFFMLRARPSGVLLSRPISVFRVFSIEGETARASSGVISSADVSASSETPRKIGVEFLILEKGNGTSELCRIKTGGIVDIIGPQGNMFPFPPKTAESVKNVKTAIVGGGIGIAPVAGFASHLSAKSYDFYACFRTGSYGLDYVDPANLFISTDDGSCGIKGMLPHLLTADEIKKRGYTDVYACGPEPMLVYVQKICSEAGVSCWLSLEAAMGCGMGACLGCTIKTTEGNKRCCMEGPVFPGDIVIFPERQPPKKKIETAHTGLNSSSSDADLMSVTIAGVPFKNPVIAASGTFGYGMEYSSIIKVNELGGICSKGLTLEPRPGNSGVRLYETPSGLINSIGLENPGIEHFISTELPSMMSLRPVAIANLSGSSLETYVEGAKLLNNTSIPMVELNISCPNVKAGGMAFGLDPGSAAAVVGAVRSVLQKPLIVKLSPNAPDLLAVAHACRRAGADALSLVNTFQAMAINVETGRPVFDNIKAGLAGPAIRPIALRMVYEVCRSMHELPISERIPVIGLGGISTWQDAVSFIMAGAHAVQVGTATFAQPDCMINIIEGIKSFMIRKGYTSLEQFRGIAL